MKENTINKYGFSVRLYNLMKKRKMTQRELAERIDVTEVSISRYVTGKRIPRTDVLSRIADLFGVTCDYLLYEKPIPPKNETNWTVDEDGVWACHTCGLLWTFMDGGVKENEMNYCPKCGKKIITEVKDGK